MAIGLRYLIRSMKYPIDNYRLIMTTSTKLEKALENLEKNPYYDKYAEKIAALQKTSPEEFLKKVQEQEKNKEKEMKKKFAPVDTRLGL